MSRRAQNTLTRIMSALFASFRESVTPAEMATSITAAVMVENEHRPFGSRATEILANIVEPEFIE